MAAGSPQPSTEGERPAAGASAPAEFFTAPAGVNQRRYEALRAFFVDGLTHAEAGARFGYTRWAMVNLVRQHRAGQLRLFAEPRKPGPPPGVAPGKERVRGRVVALRREGLSTYEISARLAAEGTPLNRTSVGEILTEEGFGRLLRTPRGEASASVATPGRDTRLPRAARLDWSSWPARCESRMAGLLLVVPDLVALDLPDLVARAGYPGTRSIGALNWLVMDQKVTTHAVLGELNDRGIKFLTLRMRSPALIKTINALTPADFKTITLDRTGKHTKPKVYESDAVKLTNYPGTVRQLIVTGLGREAPTVIITNDDDTTTKHLIQRYARRMTIEQRLAEIIRAFHTDALSSTVNLNVDLDIMLAVLAQALHAALRQRLPGYATVTPDTLQRRFLDTPGQITLNDDTVTVHLQRRAYSPVLRQADLPTNTTVPWWGGRTLRYQFA